MKRTCRSLDPRAWRGVMSVLLLAALLGAGPAAAADWQPVEEHWYVLELNDVKAGWMSIIVEQDSDRFRTSTSTRLSIGRGPTATTVKTSTAFEETHDGRPLVVRFEQAASLDPVSTEWHFGDDAVTVTSRQGARETTRRMPSPEGVWLTPQAADRYVDERRKAGATEITFRTVDPEVGLTPMTVRSTFEGSATFEHAGREIPVSKWRSSTDVVPIDVIELYSTDGYMVRSEMNAGIGRVVTRLVTRDEALAPTDGPGPEMLVKTFVRPDRPIPGVMKSRRARFRLRAIDGPLPEIPSAGMQQVEPGAGPEMAIVVVDLDAPQQASDADASDHEFRESSTMVDAEDPLIRKLASSAVRRAGDDAAARAEALRERVHRHISRKGLQTAFASASETAKTRTGDCSEHAVLLCAMLRAEGIPARIASGLIYADGFLGERDIFGWHMWTQALIDGHWIDLDATLPRAYHAGHVLTSTSGLADGAVDREMVSMLMLMGNLRIDVLEVSND